MPTTDLPTGDQPAPAPSADDILHTSTGDDRQRIPVNVFETDDALVIVAPMPGVTADDVEIVVDADTITMRADLRSTAAGKRYVMHEWNYGGYERSVPLPGVFHGEVTASLGNGQLAVSVARAGSRGPGLRPEVRPL